MSGDPAKVLIIGVGNAYRGDDRAGIAVAQQLAGQVSPGTEVLRESGEGTALVEAWKGAQFVILVDAIQSGASPGTIRRIDAREEPVRVELFPRSTHAFGVSGAIELARTLNELPTHVVVYGIEGRDFTPGEQLSPEVETAVPLAAAQVLWEAQHPA
jgi:hydrogenase maturation protease